MTVAKTYGFGGQKVGKGDDETTLSNSYDQFSKEYISESSSQGDCL